MAMEIMTMAAVVDEVVEVAWEDLETIEEAVVGSTNLTITTTTVAQISEAAVAEEAIMIVEEVKAWINSTITEAVAVEWTGAATTWIEAAMEVTIAAVAAAWTAEATWATTPTTTKVTKWVATTPRTMAIICTEEATTTICEETTTTTTMTVVIITI